MRVGLAVYSRNSNFSPYKGGGCTFENKELKQIKKKVSEAFGKKVYLLGRWKSGEYFWLEEAKWDCGWYWGFGYIEVYTNSKNPHLSRDVSSHTHWNSGVVGDLEFRLNPDKWDDVTKKYVYHLNDNPEVAESVLTDKESWELAELLKSYYTLRETAEVFGRGSSHVAGVEYNYKDETVTKQVNEKILPKLFAEIYKILSPVEPAEKI